MSLHIEKLNEPKPISCLPGLLTRWLCEPVTQCGLTQTGPAGRQLEALRALAAVAAGNVDAVGVALAQVVPAVTLIDIYARGRRRETVGINHRLCNCLVRARRQLADSRKHNSAILALIQYRQLLTG